MEELQLNMPHLNATLAWLADVDVTCSLALKAKAHVRYSGMNRMLPVVNLLIAELRSAKDSQGGCAGACQQSPSYC
jgi:hypothetical protein